jgi:F-type H+-transporting ATPase subunit b
MIRMADQNLAAGSNNIFLFPNGTFFVEAIIFVIVLLVMGWYVAPAVGKALRDREEMVQREAKESQEAQEKLTAAEQRFAQALAEARSESGRIRDNARAEGQQHLDELREQAGQEADELSRQASEALAAQREQAMRELQPHVRELAGTLAGRVVGTDVPVSEGRR